MRHRVESDEEGSIQPSSVLSNQFCQVGWYSRLCIGCPDIAYCPRRARLCGHFPREYLDTKGVIFVQENGCKTKRTRSPARHMLASKMLWPGPSLFSPRKYFSNGPFPFASFRSAEYLVVTHFNLCKLVPGTKKD